MFTECLKEHAEALYRAGQLHRPKIIDLIRQIRAAAHVDSRKAIEFVEAQPPGAIPRRALRVAKSDLAALKMRPDLFDGHATVAGGDVRELAEQVLTELAQWLSYYDARNLFLAYWKQTGIDLYKLGQEIADDPDGWFDDAPRRD